MFLFIITTAACTWKGGNEKQATWQNKRAPVSFTASVNRRALVLIDLSCRLMLLLLAGLNSFFIAIIFHLMRTNASQDWRAVIYVKTSVVTCWLSRTSKEQVVQLHCLYSSLQMWPLRRLLQWTRSINLPPATGILSRLEYFSILKMEETLRSLVDMYPSLNVKSWPA